MAQDDGITVGIELPKLYTWDFKTGQYKMILNQDGKITKNYKGGIYVKYGETYGDDGLWEGSLYVFDDRMGTEFSDHAKVIGTCIHCGGKTSNYENCALKTCNELVLICGACKQDEAKLYHTADCYQAVAV